MKAFLLLSLQSLATAAPFFMLQMETWLESMGLSRHKFPANMFSHDESLFHWNDGFSTKVALFYAPYPYDYDSNAAARVFAPGLAIMCYNVADWNCGPSCDMTNVTFVQRMEYVQTGAAVMVGVLDDSHLMVNFRGTSSSMEMRRNTFFGTLQRFCSACQIHRGFLSHYSYLRRWIFLRLDYLRNKLGVASIVTSSISLGAACSVIFMADAPVERWPVLMSYTFGSPRTGNVGFKEHLETKRANSTYRVVNYRDAVPHLPPLITGYSSIFPEIFHDRNYDKFSICDDSKISRLCSSYFTAYTWSDHITYFKTNTAKNTINCGGYTNEDVNIHESYDLLLLDLTS